VRHFHQWVPSTLSASSTSKANNTSPTLSHYDSYNTHSFSFLSVPHILIVADGIAPVGPVEGALQITYAFGECGSHHMTQIVNEGTLPALINAVHSTDLCEHRHQYVLLSYFDLSYRYLKLCLPEAVSCITNMLTGKSGLYHPNMQVRCRAAYAILKITEQLENRAYLLVPHTEIFASKLSSSYSL
jgi:hypothetical protein